MSKNYLMLLCSFMLLLLFNFNLPAFSQDEDSSSKKIKELTRDLGDPSFRVRENAEKELKKLNKEALPFLEKLLNSKDAEIVVRAKRIIEYIKRKEKNEDIGFTGEPDDETMNKIKSSGKSTGRAGSGVIIERFSGPQGIHEHRTEVYIDDSKVKVIIRENGEVKEYEARDIEELKNKYPEIEKKIDIKFFGKQPFSKSLWRKIGDIDVKDIDNKIKELQKRLKFEADLEFEKLQEKLKMMEKYFNELHNILKKRASSDFFEDLFKRLKELELRWEDYKKNFSPMYKFKIFKDEPKLKPVMKEKPNIGLYLDTITDELSREEKLPSSEGLIVRKVEKDGAGEKILGLQENDIILSLNDKKVQNPWNFMRNLKDLLEEKKPLKLIILRNNEKKVISLNE